MNVEIVETDIHFEYDNYRYDCTLWLRGRMLHSVRFFAHEIVCWPILNDFLREFIDVSDVKYEVLDQVQDVLDGKWINELVGVDFTKAHITPEVTIFYQVDDLEEKDVLANRTEHNSIDTRLFAAFLQAVIDALETP